MKATNGTPAMESSKSYREGGNISGKSTAIDDVTHSKPYGQRVADGDCLKTRNGLLKIGTWNVRTLFQSGKFANLCQEFDTMKVDIMGVAETRWNGSGKITENGKTMIYSGGEENCYGVGIVMSSKVTKSMIGYWPISNRVILVKLQGHPVNINIIQVYAPTTDHPDEEIEVFYEEITTAKKYAKSGEVMIIMGDFNAKLGKESHKPITGGYGLGEINERGMRLIEFCKETKMVVTNTFFKHHPKLLYTWKSPGDIHRNQIDYILINERFKNSIKNTKTYPGADINSDHNPLVMKMKLRLKSIKLTPKKENHEMNMLKVLDYNERYNIEVRNNYNQLVVEEQSQEPSEEKEWDIIKKCMNKALTTVIPIKKKKKQANWMNNEILQLMKDRKSLKNRPQAYNEKDKEIRAKCKQAKETFWNTKCEEIERLEREHKSREMHKKIKETTESKTYNIGGCIKDKEGNILFEEEEIEKRWMEYIEELYSDERCETPPQIDETDEGEDILLDEIKSAVKDLKNGKAPGLDNITSEMLKALNEDNIKIIHRFCNTIYKNGQIPGNLGDSIFITIPKKPKAKLCTEYRTISLMSHILKIILRVILKRCYNTIDWEIDEFQSGFRKGMGTREGIFNMKIIAEKYIDVNKDIYVCLIDYQKAFDRVNHEKLIECLRGIG